MVSSAAHVAVGEAFNSMLRTDYIPLSDVEKLQRLADYYVDYFGYIPQVVVESDQLIVGRRGTGKTTLLYRALVECMRSWGEDPENLCKPRTLGIYVDLSKCQSLYANSGDFEQFEHAFVSEVCDAIVEQMNRFWPSLGREPGFLTRLFRATEAKRTREVRELLARFAQLLQTGVPRFVDKSSPVSTRESRSRSSIERASAQAEIANNSRIGGSLGEEIEETYSSERTYDSTTVYRLTVSDILRLLSDLKTKAELSAIYLFIDEYSALPEELQRRFSTLLRKILGSHAGVFVKLSAITDKYTLGSSIILQRDLFEVSLDLDAYVERSGTLNDAMDGLRELVSSIVASRLGAYDCPKPQELFDSPDDAWVALSRSAMGVPRTLGIVLQQAWSRSQTNKAKRIRKTDLQYGIQYASRAYYNQMVGAATGSVAIPSFVNDLWVDLINRAQNERVKSKGADGASHFMVLPKYEHMLKHLNMFFLVHLLTKGRTTKKQKFSRSLYCFDYGTCEENSLGFATDKNVLRQQRFAYDGVLAKFESDFNDDLERQYRCPEPGCTFTLRESEMYLKGLRVTACPLHRLELISDAVSSEGAAYTEEEVKILGAIRSAKRKDQKLARQVADDVGCYVQKVARFAEKLERAGLVVREKLGNKLIYYGTSSPRTLRRRA